MSDFERALQATLRYEGGKVNDFRDPGGKTAFGVTQRTFDAWCRSNGHARRDVFSITPAEIRSIYKTGFWDPVTAGRTWSLDACLFDAAVNHGPNTALWLLDEVRHHVSPTDPKRMLKLALLVCDRRAHFYRLLVQRRPSLGVFLTGWLRRVGEQQKLARQPAGGYSLAPDAPLELASPALFTPRTPDDAHLDVIAAGDAWTPDPATLSDL